MTSIRSSARLFASVCSLESRTDRRDSLLDLGLDRVGELSHRGALGLGDLAHAAQHGGQLTLAAEHPHPNVLESRSALAPFEIGQGNLTYAFESGAHGADARRYRRPAVGALVPVFRSGLPQVQAAIFDFAIAAISENAAGSFTARSASTLRSTSTPAFFKPLIKLR